jgi:hypothetical protein
LIPRKNHCYPDLRLAHTAPTTEETLVTRTRALRNTLIGAAAVAALTLVSVTPASATIYTRGCGGAKTYITGVISSLAQVADSTAGTVGDCGTVAVRIRYNLPIGITVYSSWASGSNYAVSNKPAGATLLSADSRGGNYYHYTLTP